MKKNKVLIICCIIISIIGAFIYYKNVNKNMAEYSDINKNYKEVVDLSKKINDRIDEKISQTEKYISNIQNNEQNKEDIAELTNIVTEFENLKVTIEEKSGKLNDINDSTQKMKKQITNIDDKFLENNMNVNNNQSEINFSENSNFNKLNLKVDSIIQKMNDQSLEQNQEDSNNNAVPISQTEIASIENILNGDFSNIAGTYKSGDSAYSQVLTVNAEGKISGTKMDGLQGSEKPKLIEKQADGSYKLTYSVYWNWPAWLSEGWNDAIYYIVPIGVEYRVFNDMDGEIKTDSSKIRVIDTFVDGDRCVYYKD